MCRSLALATLLLTGCGSTVYRLEGAPITPGGTAQTPCESRDWLVLAPTRAEVTDGAKGTSHPVKGLGLYRVGSDSPESIPGEEGLASSSVEHKRAELAPYDRRQIIAGALGAAGVIAIAVGTVLFVNAFGTRTTIDAMGIRHEDNPVNGTMAGAGGAIVGGGFALGIAGLVVNPDHAERTQARATRYVFLNPPDDPKSVEAMTAKHNAAVRESCSKAP